MTRHSSTITPIRSRYAPATPETLALLTDRVTSGRLNMLFAGASIGAEAAGLALAMDAIVRRDAAAGDAGETDERHYTFFANSAEEAVSGTVKLLRHNAVLRAESSTGTVLLVDTRGDEAAAGSFALARHLPDLYPGIEVLSDAAGARARLASGAAVGIIAVADPSDPATSSALVRDAAAAGVLSAFADFSPVTAARSLVPADCAPDVLVYGENLGGAQVPFGCFVMPARIYAAWNNVTDSLAHTSTFGANGACLSVVAAHLRRTGIVDDEVAAHMDVVASDRLARNAAFRRHVNPKAASGLEMFGQDLDVAHARGMILRLRDRRQVYDLAGGTGANLRGHNPLEVIDALTAESDATDDPVAALEAEFRDALGGVRLIPAVSGATAVDAALQMAALAAEGRTVLSFHGNYSGKTVPSIALSQHGPQRTASHPRAFAPYSDSVVYLDPFAPDAVAAFHAALETHDVGLVWFELVQGLQCMALPPALVEAIRARRTEYLVGIDEVLTGFHRAGEHLLYQDDLGLRADVTTLAKPLSDMVLPFGAALVADAVWERAQARDPEAVELLATRHALPLTARVALGSLRWVRARAADGSIARTKERVHARLAEAVRRSPAFSAVQGQGLLIRLLPDTDRFPERPKGSQLGQLLEVSMQDLLLRRHGVLVAQQRFFPPITPDPEQFEAALDAVVRGAADLTPARVWANAARRVVGTVFAAWFRSARRRLAS